MHRLVERGQNTMGATKMKLEQTNGVEANWLAQAATLHPGAHFRLDAQGRITHAAGRTDAALGPSAEGCVGQDFGTFAAVPRREALHSTIRFIAERGSTDATVLPGPIGRMASATWRAASDGTGGVVVSCLLGAPLDSEDAPLVRLADLLPVCVAYLDRHLRYRFNNQAYESFFGVDRQKLRGSHVSSMVDERSLEQLLPVYERVLAGECVSYCNPIELRDGRVLEMKVDYLPDVTADGCVNGFYAVIQDVTQYAKTIELLKAIHRIVNRTAEPTDATLTNLLILGRAYLGLPNAIVARVEGGRYIVRAASAASPVAERGQEFDLGNTYCSLTLAAEDVVAVPNAGEDERVCGHPCYQNFGLETYIGVPIRLQGQTWGTLNFSAAVARQKPFNDLELELVRLIGNAVEHLVDRQMRMERYQRENQRLEGLAYTDPLTGLPNRKAIQGRLEQLDSEGVPYSIAVVDIDHFKNVNDTFGHDAGDLVLYTLAQLIDRELRTRDLVGRYGGEEFLVVMENTSVTDAARALERLRRLVADKRIELSAGQALFATLSAGVAEATPSESSREVFQRADAALYQAKQLGRNRIAEAAAPLSDV